MTFYRVLYRFVCVCVFVIQYYMVEWNRGSLISREFYFIETCWSFDCLCLLWCIGLRQALKENIRVALKKLSQKWLLVPYETL